MILAILAPGCARASVQADVAFDQIAQRLELVRNQIELTIENHASLAKDLGRQEREFRGMGVYAKIPLSQNDFKSDPELLANLKGDFERAATKHTGFRLRKLAFAGKWRNVGPNIPAALPFDTDYRIPEDQLVDERKITFEVKFDLSAPVDPSAWLREQSEIIRRLIVPLGWKRNGTQVSGTALIFRFRNFEYPKMLAPDLSKYKAPGPPTTEAQNTAARRLARYRSEVIKLWPKCQPYLDDLRQFARNDLRMSFFLKHATLH